MASNFLPTARSSIALGHLHWFNENRPRAYRSAMLTLNPDDETGRERVFQDASVTADELINRGRRVRVDGVASHWAEKYTNIRANGPDILLFRAIQYDALELDAVLSPNSYDRVNRKLQFPKWRSNTCAVDTVIAAATLLDAGLLRVDQIPPSQIYKRSIPSQALLHYLSFDLGIVSVECLDKCRDLLLQALQGFDSIKYSGPTSFQPCQSMFEDCLHLLPQISFTHISANRLCQEKEWTSSGRPIPWNMVWVNISQACEGETFGQLVQRLAFGHTEVRPSDQPCSLGQTCPGHTMTTHHTLILDRIPPRLCVSVVYTPERVPTYNVCTAMKCSRPLKITYTTRKRESVAWYNPIGAVFHVNGNHYILRWKVRDTGGQECLIEIDMGVRKQLRTTDWWEGLEEPSDPRNGNKRAAKLYIIIYQLSSLP